MKKGKLNLDGLKVRSFVTTLEDNSANTIVGASFNCTRNTVHHGCAGTDLNAGCYTGTQPCIGGGTGNGGSDDGPQEDKEKWTGAYVCGGASSDGAC